jgi:hypothetical protein
MKNQSTKPQLRESSSLKDLVKMQPEVALFESMSKSKTLTVMVIVSISSFLLFLYFLFNTAVA